MGRAGLWCVGLVSLVLLGGCAQRKPPAQPRDAERAEGGQTATPAPAGEALNEAPMPCDVPGKCPEGSPGLEGDDTEAVLSPDQRFGLVWPVDARAAHMDVYDAQRHQRLTRIAADEAVAGRVWASNVRWTSGNNILLTWGSGSNAVSGVLYDTSGARLLEVDASALTVSPSGRYLATYPSLLAGDPAIEVYDLSTGRQVARNAPEGDIAREVQSIQWKGQRLEAHSRDSAGRTHQVLIELDSPP